MRKKNNPKIFDGIDLSEECVHCGEEYWQHTHRRSPHGIDLMPCELKFRQLCYKFTDYDYDELTRDGGLCRECGKPFINHFAFQRFSLTLMNVRVWDSNEITYLVPVGELSCKVVSEDGPLFGLIAPKSED